MSWRARTRPVLVLLAAISMGAGPPPALPVDRRQGDLATLREAELAFARRNMERGQRESWLAWFAADGIMFDGGPVLAHQRMGDPDVPAAPAGAFDWRPAFGDVSSSGDLGYHTGPVRITSTGRCNVWFFSVWRRQAGGEWRVAVDLGTRVAAPDCGRFDDPYEPARATETLSKEGVAGELATLDRSMRSGTDLIERAGANARGLRTDRPPMEGRDAYERVASDTPGPLVHSPSGEGFSAAGDLAYTYGRYVLGEPAGESGSYVRVWRRDATGQWRIVFDVLDRDPPAE